DSELDFPSSQTLISPLPSVTGLPRLAFGLAPLPMIEADLVRMPLPVVSTSPLDAYTRLVTACWWATKLDRWFPVDTSQSCTFPLGLPPVASVWLSGANARQGPGGGQCTLFSASCKVARSFSVEGSQSFTCRACGPVT